MLSSLLSQETVIQGNAENINKAVWGGDSTTQK